MRSDLLRRISEERDITNAIVLTHNIDFVFLQTLVLSALQRCGHPSLTVFADSGCASTAYAHQAPVLDGLGVRYRVVPVEMAPGFRFHPKAVLVSGAAYAALHIGSGNLTFGGWRENAEVWFRFDTRTDGTGTFAAFLNYLNSVLERVALPESVRAEIAEAFDPKTRSWATALDEPVSLFGKVTDGAPLVDQMLGALGNVRIDRVTICAPYFDEEGEALAHFVRRVAPAQVTVLVQTGRTGLTKSAWKRVRPSPHLAAVQFRREGDNGSTREAFIHAKFYAFEHQNLITVFLGSANCSRAALTIPGKAGNAELLAVRAMNGEEFRDFINELIREEARPVLATEIADASPAAVPALRVLGASYEGGYLRIAYAPTEWRITECQIDGVSSQFEELLPGVVGAHAERPPRQVVLLGTDGEAVARSAAGWVDHEGDLRSSARGRSVAEAIRSRVRAGQWGIGAWTEVLDILCAHLRYLPPRLSPTAVGGPGRKRREGESVAYSAKDVFAAGYRLPSLGALLPSLPGSRDGRVRSLQQLLLRWFGIPILDDENHPEESTSTEGVDDEEAVDRPEQLPGKTPQSTLPKSTERDRLRVERLVAQLGEAMTSNDFLDERPPELLAADLRVASALLRIALSERWLDSTAFFRVTHRIWSALFLAIDGGGDCRLQRRYRSATSPEDFAAAMRSPDVVAALAAWVLGVPSDATTPEHARFALTAALAIAQLPWLWDDVDDEDVCRELTELLANTDSGADQIDDLLGERWLRFVQRGHALRRLESALAGQTPLQLCSKVSQQRLSAGDLLWQGTSGFCVVMKSAERTAKTLVRVLKLQSKENESNFSAEFTVPMLALLDERVVPASASFGHVPRRFLRDFLTELANGFQRGPGETPARQ